MLFRKARPDDLPQILDVVHQAQAFMATLNIDQWQDGYPSAELLAEDIRIGRAYVCEDGGKAVSICILTAEPEPVYDILDGQWHADGPYLTVHRMALDDAHRHTGLAAFIMDHAFSMAREQGLGSVRADTHRGNAAMRGFLEKKGFCPCGLVNYPVDFGDPVRIAYDFVF